MKEKFGSSFSGKQFKNGAYSSVITTIVVALIIVVNLIAGKFDMTLDISKDKLYTLTDTTKDYIKELNDDITIYYFAKKDGQNEVAWNLVNRYAAESSHITVTLIDPSLYPDFVYRYVERGISVYADSMVVEDTTNGRFRFVDSNDMFQYQMDYTTYEYVLQGYDIEGQVTSAIQYVTDAELPKVYLTTGHGELGYGAEGMKLLEKQNVETVELETIKATAIPDDCDTLAIVGPSSDFSEKEIEIIKDYLAGGGSAVIYYDYSEEDQKNLRSLLEYYGVNVVEGIVFEGDADHMMNNIPYYQLPNILNCDLTNSINEHYLGDYTPIGLVTENVRDSITYTPILGTSDTAYSKVDPAEGTFVQTQNDISGPFDLALMVEENVGDVRTRIAVYGGSRVIDDTFLQNGQMGNDKLMTNTYNWTIDREKATISIPTKKATEEFLTIPNADVNRIAFITVIVIPVFIFVYGLVVVIRRRKV